MSSVGSISKWISRLKAGDKTAAQHIWERYFQRLVERARRKLAGTPRQAADEEDVALSAMDSFCDAAAQGRFPKLHDRGDLWQLLVMIAERKAVDLYHHERRAKRGGDKMTARREPAARNSSGVETPLDDLVDRDPTPQEAAVLVEEYQRLMDLLGESDLKVIAQLKMEGYSIKEIAEHVGCVPRTVDRRLLLIRAIWKKEVDRK